MPGGVGLGSSHPKRHGVPHPSRTFLGSHARYTDALDNFLVSFLLCGFAKACLSFPGVSSALVWSCFHGRRVFP